MDTFSRTLSDNEKTRISQRTTEWYQFRHKLITASNAYKAFESQAQKNQLIYEKCKPLVIDDDTDKRTINVNSPMHWGQKYEPVSVMLYESMYKTKIGDFGCIQHDKWPFIGASPDGINVDPESSRYGRLLEIKNIVNREIDGIPKKEYWVQMQLQMETCDLDECDFLECRFVEYKASTTHEGTSEEQEFMMDGDTMQWTQAGERKGIIAYFNREDGNPLYVYMPLTIDTYKEYVEWEINTIKTSQDNGLTWIGNLYWCLAEMSCVLVDRNRRWFNDNIQSLSDIWDIIVRERGTGYEHRASNKKKRSESICSDASNITNLNGTQLLTSWYKRNTD